MEARWVQSLSKNMTKVADRTGERRRTEGAKQTSIVWCLKPSIAATLAQGEEETMKAIDELPAKKRKKDKGMDYIKAFRK